MAGISNQSKAISCHFVHDIVFDGALLSTTRAALVSELLHYFLYERQQIPLPVDQLHFRTSAWASEEPSSSSSQQKADHHLLNHCQSQGKAKKIASNRKAKSLLADLNCISNNLKKAFETCTEVEQVAVLLGGTVMNPKETLLIKFPPPCPDADCLPLDKCKRTLFKQIISEDILGSLTTNISLSNICVLLLAPRSLPLAWFLPKHSMRTPKTGTVVTVNFHCTYLVPICHELTIVEGDNNISGLEALDCSQCEKEFSEHSETFENDFSSNSPSDLTKSSKRKHSSTREILGDLPSLERLSASVSDNVISQFCQHQRLNYIFNCNEKNFKKMLKSPSGRTLSSAFLQSCAVTVTGSACDDSLHNYTCEEDIQSKGQFSCQDLDSKGEIEMDRNLKESVDCIWYQSPVTLKGFKE